ncbi:calcium/sodium antiporter [Holdemania massiliensis]|uniref:calcium/sodium antiporter n=1 Tax=Holdemania massiliensis TaxID=1468449 RepID=UPI0036F2E0F6
MSIEVAVILFLAGVFLVVKGGDLFVEAASWIAKASSIPSFIVGATIVSLATTLPEMIVSVIAALQGKTEMAIGNAVGSVIANTGLILAVAMVFMTIAIQRKDYIKHCVLLITAAAVLFLFSLSGALSFIGSLILIGIFLISMVLNVRNAMQQQEDTERIQTTRKEIIRRIVMFLFGALGIVAGSQLLVNSGSALAAFFGVPERIVAVTMIAIGTSLPELVTTVTAIIKKESSLSIGNLIGANILDLTLILPICSFVSGQALPVSAQSLALDMPACLLITIVALLPLLMKEKGSKIQGLSLILSYSLYLFFVL